ncbi:hypothetical protein E5K00_17465 [Hymenobacter aquaticus]|uniref:Outer membrane protein beta-barrel domain-containing protein n=1 Tax=Hymenobacter aquaticus TaxID=1867101 RepID=A0A4Z0PYP5_9BACT|nr:hypothetical protein [Hymenobacter aquaticus]TGE22041.1 hypothetical protein E5K00_17465 [Hymenobacter aquaticus]
MRTPDMSDEELDALFQRGAEQYPDEYNLSAWLQMERKLEAAAAEQLVQRRVLRIFALEAVVLLVALLGWLGLSSPGWLPATDAGRVTERLASTPQSTQPTVGPGPAATPAARGLVSPPEPPATSLVQPVAAASAPPATREAAAQTPPAAATGPADTRPGRVRKPVFLAIGSGTPTRKPRRTTADTEPTSEPARTASTALTRSVANHPARRHRRPALMLALTESNRPAGRVSGLSAEPAATAPVAASNVSTTTSVPAPASSSATTGPAAETVAPEAAVAAATRPGSEPLPVRTSGATHADSAATPALAAAALPTAPPTTPPPAAPADSAAEKPSRPQPAYRFSLGLLYAPELSSGGWVQKAGLGSNLGVQLEYRFTDRLRVNVAALRAVKRYAARGSDYHPPAGYWTNYFTIDEVDATCNITDLPINLRYDVLRRANASAFASVGLSTLLMRNEQYRYGYDYNGKYVVRDWSLAKGSNHWVSVVNLSVGYEHSLRGRWSAQGEPFVKIPLGGVGFGKVKLSSAGVFFNLKYSLLPTAPR